MQPDCIGCHLLREHLLPDRDLLVDLLELPFVSRMGREHFPLCDGSLEIVRADNAGFGGHGNDSGATRERALEHHSGVTVDSEEWVVAP